MIQIILILIAIVAFVKETIPVTKNTEVIRPKTFIVGSYALLIALLASLVPKIAFYAMLVSFIIFIGFLRKKKQLEVQQDVQL